MSPLFHIPPVWQHSFTLSVEPVFCVNKAGSFHRVSVRSAQKSDSPASPEADSGRQDSAHTLHNMQDPPVRSLDLFAGHELDLSVDHQPWGAYEQRPDFHTRFAVAAYASAQAPDSISGYDPSLDGDNTSMTVTMRSHTTFSTPSARNAPSLGSYSTAPSRSSIRSWEAESAVAAGAIDDGGNLIAGASLAVLPPSGLRCLFSFLACSRVFYNPVAWHDHSKSHFQGATPPRYMRLSLIHI